MTTTIFLVILLIVVGLVISLFGSIVGLGGGIFLVPILILFFDFDLDIAVGTAMVSIVPSTLISTFLNKKEGNVDFKLGILLESPTIIGVIIGSVLLSSIAPKALEIVFAVLIFSLGISFFLRKKESGNKVSRTLSKLNKLKPNFVIKNAKNNIAYRASLQLTLLFGFVAGTLAGLFGVGGGFMKTPIMIKVFKVPAKIAAATALFMILITSITGSISHYLQGNVVFEKAWPVMVGFALGAIVGHQINTHIKASVLEKLIGIALVAAALIMVLNFVV